MLSEKFVGFSDTLRAIDPFLVGRVVLEFATASLAGRPLFRILPVAVVFPGVGITIVTVVAPRLRVVELYSTTFARPVR